jgi:hypothetical protein
MNPNPTIARFQALTLAAVILFAMALLFPMTSTARSGGKSTVCLANLHLLGRAWTAYPDDNDGYLAQGVVTRINSPSFGLTWDRPWLVNPCDNAGNYTDHDSTLEEKFNGIRKGSLFPYTQTENLYHCPADTRYLANVGSRGRGPYASYVIGLGLYGELTVSPMWMTGGKNIWSLMKFSEIKSPGGKVVFVEEGYANQPGTTGPINVGFSPGSWLMWRGGNWDSWWDPLGDFHNEQSTLGYTDGHAETWKWYDKRTVLFAHDRLWNGTTDASYVQPNNPDLQKLSSQMPYKETPNF